MKKLEKQPSTSTGPTGKSKPSQLFDKILNPQKATLTGPVPSEGAKTKSDKSEKSAQNKDEFRDDSKRTLIPLEELLQTIVIEHFTTLSIEAESIHPLFSIVLVVANFFLAGIYFNSYAGFSLKDYLSASSQTSAIFTAIIVVGSFGIWSCAVPPLVSLLQADRTEPICLRVTKDYLGLLTSTERGVKKRFSVYCLQLAFYLCAPFSLSVLLMHLTVFVFSAAGYQSAQPFVDVQSMSAFGMALAAVILNSVLCLAYAMLVDTSVPTDGFLSATSRSAACLMVVHFGISGALNIISYANIRHPDFSWSLQLIILFLRVLVPAVGLYQCLAKIVFFNRGAMLLYVGGFLVQIVCVLYYFIEFVEKQMHPGTQKNFIAPAVLMIGITIGTRVLYNCRPRADSLRLTKESLSLRDILLCIQYFKDARRMEAANNWDVLGYYMLVMTRDLYPDADIQEFLSEQSFGEEQPDEPTYQGVAFIMHLFDLLGKKLSHPNARHLRCRMITYQLHFLVSLNFNMRSLSVLLGRRKKMSVGFFTLYSLSRLEKTIRDKIRKTNINREKLSFDVEGPTDKQEHLFDQNKPKKSKNLSTKTQIASFKTLKQPAASKATLKPTAEKLKATMAARAIDTTEEFEANPNLQQDLSEASQNTEEECVQIMQQLQDALDHKSTGRKSSVSVLRAGNRAQDVEYFMLNNSVEVRTEHQLDLYQYLMTQRITERFIASLDGVVTLVLQFFEILGVARPAMPTVHKVVTKIAHARCRVEHLFESLNAIHNQLGRLSPSRLHVLTYSYFVDQVFSDKQLSLSLLKEYKNTSRLDDPLLSAILTNPVVGDVYMPLEECSLLMLDAHSKHLGTVTWASKTTLVGLGMDSTTVVGRNIHDMIPEDFRVSHYQRMEQVCRGGSNDYFSKERLRFLRMMSDRSSYMRAIMQVQISPSINNGLNFLSMIRRLKSRDEFLVFSQKGELIGYSSTLGPGSRSHDFSRHLGEDISEFSADLQRRFLRFVYNELNSQNNPAAEDFIADVANKGISLDLLNTGLEEEIYVGSEVVFHLTAWDAPKLVNATFKSAEIFGVAGEHHLEVYVMLKFPKEQAKGFGINLAKYTSSQHGNKLKKDPLQKLKEQHKSANDDFSVQGINSEFIRRLDDEPDDESQDADADPNGVIDSLKRFEIGMGILSKVYNVDYSKKIKQLSNLMESHITKGIQKDQEDRESVVSSINSTVHRDKINFIRSLSKRKPLFRYMLWLGVILVLFLASMIYGLVTLELNFVSSLKNTIVGRSVVRLIVLLDSFLQSGTVVLNYRMLDSLGIVPDNPIYFGSLGLINIPTLATEYARIVSDLGNNTKQLLDISKQLSEDQWSMFRRYSKSFSPILLQTPENNFSLSLNIDFAKVAFEGLTLLNHLNSSYGDVGFTDYRVMNLTEYLEQVEEDVTLKTLVDFYDSENTLYQQRQKQAVIAILVAEIVGFLLGIGTLLVLTFSKLKMNMIYFGLSKVANFEIVFKKDLLLQLGKTISKTRDTHEAAEAVTTASMLSKMAYREYKTQHKQQNSARRLAVSKWYYFGLGQAFFPICTIMSLSPLVLLIYLNQLSTKSGEYVACLGASKEHLLLFYRSNVFATQATWVKYIKAGVVPDPTGSKLNYSLTQMEALSKSFSESVHALRVFTDSTTSGGIYSAFDYLKQAPINLVNRTAPADRRLANGNVTISSLAADSFGKNTLQMHEYQGIKYRDLLWDLKSVGLENGYSDVGQIVFSDATKEIYLIQRFFMRYIVDAFQVEFIRTLLEENDKDSQQLKNLLNFLVVVTFIILILSILATWVMKRQATVSMSSYSLLAFESFTENTLLKAHTNLLKQL